jgi:hypothetical protein
MERESSRPYLFKSRSGKTVHTQNDRAGTNNGSCNQKDFMLNLRNGAENETDDGAGCAVNQSKTPTGKLKAHTNEQEPSDANGADESTISETLNPQGKRETAPSANKILGCFPEEDGESPSSDPSNEG